MKSAEETMPRVAGAAHIPRVVRTAALVSALAACAAIAALLIYIVYVYNLWVHAMRAEGPPGSPPP